MQGGLAGVLDLLLDAARPGTARRPSSRSTGPMPPPSRRMPISGSSSISTSAIIQLVEGSHPGKSMPAALRTRLRPPSQPTRYSARSDRAVGQLDVDAGVVLGEAHHLAAREGSARRARRPSRPGCARSRLCQSAEHVVVAGGEVADVQRDPGEAHERVRPGPPTRNRSAMPRWSSTSMVRECRPPAREPSSSWLARRSTMTTSIPASASSPASISPVGPPPAITTACSVIAVMVSTIRSLAASPLPRVTSSGWREMGTGGHRRPGSTGGLRRP